MSNEPFSTQAAAAQERDEAGSLPARATWQAILLGPKLEENRLWVALAYLIGLSVAEVLAVLLLPVAGILLYFLLLSLLLLHAALTWERPIHRFLLSLTLVPLIRIISFSLPLFGFRLEFWYFFTSVPLFVAAYVVMRQLGMSWRQVGVTWRGWPLQLAIGLSGIVLGYVEYLILRPEPLVESFTWAAIWLAALILLISTGFLEEYIFRGIMQITAVEQLGRLVGVSYVALFFAVLHVGYRSMADFIFVLVVGLGFGFIVLATQNIMGVTLAHGLTNIFLFLVFPFVIGNSQGPLLPLAQSVASEATPTPTITMTVEADVSLLDLPTSTPSPTNVAIPPTQTAIAPPPTATASPTTSPTLEPTFTPVTTAAPTYTVTAKPSLVPLAAQAVASNVVVRVGPGISYPLWMLLPPQNNYESVLQK